MSSLTSSQFHQWESAFWREQIALHEADIAGWRTCRPSGWERNVRQFEETLAAMRFELAEVEAEEKERPTWTPEQWQRAAMRTRGNLARVQHHPNPDVSIQSEVITEGLAMLKFYERGYSDALANGVAF